MTDTAQPAPRSRSILLIASLCLNVILAAVIAFGIYNAARFHARIESRNPLAPHALMRAADSADRAKIRAVLQSHAARFRELRRQSEAARGAAFRSFSAANFNQADFAKALERVRQADSAMEQEIIAITAQSVAQLSPAERQAIVAKVRARGAPGWRMYHRHR